MTSAKALLSVLPAAASPGPAPQSQLGFVQGCLGRALRASVGGRWGASGGSRRPADRREAGQSGSCATPCSRAGTAWGCTCHATVTSPGALRTQVVPQAPGRALRGAGAESRAHGARTPACAPLGTAAWPRANVSPVPALPAPVTAVLTPSLGALGPRKDCPPRALWGPFSSLERRNLTFSRL